MATYSAIANSEIDADSPITAALMAKIRDNPIASHKYKLRGSQSAGVTNSIVLIDDGTLEFAADAATAYAFRFVTYAQDDTGNQGVRIAIKIPSGATINVHHQLNQDADGLALAAASIVYVTTTDDDPIHIAKVAADYYSCVSEGIVVTSGAGTVKLRYAGSVATGGATTYIESASYVMYHRVDAL